MNRSALYAALTVALMAPSVGAQELKSSLIDDFQRQRGNVLGMVEAMPEAGLRTAPTEGVRDFAQQIEHVVQGNVGIIQSGIDAPVDIPQMDPEVYLNSKEELKRMVNVGYDLIGEMLAGMSDADLNSEASLFGQATVQKWQLVKTAYEHGVWTLGATIPYVRMQDGTPPGYNLIPGS
ncbi:MAG: DinB family protein [Longimicrobiales bacterium]